MKTNLHALAAQNHRVAEVDERQIEATLALAYEQRTANLIAVLQLDYIAPRGPEAEIYAQITERLGLK